MAYTKPAKTSEIKPYVPPMLNEVSFKDIRERHLIKDHTNTQGIRKGESYFHHVPSGFNFTYNGFFDEKNICVVDPRTRQLVKLTEKQFSKEFKLAGPATVKESKK